MSDMMVKTTGDGWLLVLLDGGEKVSIPEYCHVTQTGTSGGRDSITILEGPYAGKTASVKTGYLTAKSYGTAAAVKFLVASNKLTWPGGEVVAFTQESNKVPQGTWNIETPDFPHDLGAGYTSFTKHARTWFRIASPVASDRFIHPGTVSLGCATVGVKSDKTSDAGQSALKGYEKIYAYLIGRRKSDGIVGTIKVVH